MTSQTLPFKTELQQILDIIIHSLYSHPEIFLRELISNASDAIDTLRFAALTNPALREGGEDWKIKIIPDKTSGTLTICDNGVGMSRETIVENLGTIAKSGTRALLDTLKQADVKDRPELIGQFGVGFYSSFMVADKVVVRSRAAGATGAEAVQWQSAGKGEFEVEEITKAERGTDVTLHLKEDYKEFLDEWKIRDLVRKHSDFVEHPIVMDVTKSDDKDQKETKEETLNSRQALWLRPKSEIKEEEYNEFYKHLSHDFENPARVVHYSAEGAVELKALLYLPNHKPLDLMWGDSAKGLQLYIRRVFILDDSETLLPKYLRWVKGVIDSPDLPLNVSRELIQKSPLLEKIKSNVTGKVIRTLEEMKTDSYDAFVKFYRDFSTFLKEGVAEDRTNREKLSELLLFESTKTEAGQFTSLAKYILAMPEGQNEIYYFAGENRELIENSPYLERFKAEGKEVLILTEPIDDYLMSTLGNYKEKKLQAVDKGNLQGDEVDDATKAKCEPLLKCMKSHLPDLKDVRITHRLRDSAACLVTDEWGMSAYMERVLERMGRAEDARPSKRILELNPRHPLVEALVTKCALNAEDERLPKYCRMLYDQAVIAEGSRIKDPLAWARDMNEIMLRDMTRA